MKKKILVGMLVLVAVVSLVLVFGSTYTPGIPAKHGGVDTHLYLGDSLRQPLIVAFGGGSGGNDWERNYLKPKRDSMLAQGFAVLAVGYFKTDNTPSTLDRISLDAIADTIRNIASRTPQIDTSRIVLMGASKGGELVLNLASRYSFVKGVIALSTSHASFPALTWSANTSSWSHQGREVPYVPAPFEVIWPALKGDLFGAFTLMLQNKEAVKQAEIEVEKINGPILILSANRDEQWPATDMSYQLEQRLKSKNFSYSVQHVVVDGQHTEPLNHFNYVYRFLQTIK